MKPYPANRLRNVGIMGHTGSGKTMLAEAMLLGSGAVGRLGRVEDGSTVADYEPEEVKRGGSTNLAIIPVEWQEHKLNVLDTPGYADFVGEVVEALHTIDAAVILVEATAGVQVGTEQVWQRCDEQALPRMVVVSRVERENADLSQVVSQLRTVYGSKVAAVQLPIGKQDDFQGVVDLIGGRALLFDDEGGVREGPIPDELKDEADALTEQLIEAVAETDDDLILKYLEGEGLTPDEVREGLKKGIAQHGIVPVFVCAATAGKGIALICDAMVDFLPAPTDRGVSATSPSGDQTTELSADAEGPLVARVFKTQADPFVGKLTYFRVYSGTLRSDSHVWNTSREEDERIGQVMMVRGKTQEPVSMVGAGDIGAVAKLSETATGDVLCEQERPLALPAVAFPAPVYPVALLPKSKSDLDRMGAALARLQEEDRTITVERNAETAQSVLFSMGDSHTEVSLERVRRKFGADLTTEPVRIPYRETIAAAAAAEGRHVKQSGGHGQFGVCTIELQPLPRGGEYEFVDEIVGGAISRGYRSAVDKGIREAMEKGVLAGYPVVDVRARLFDGKEHSVDSSELSFKIAGTHAFEAAAREAGVVLLEPIMAVEVRVPDTFNGDIIADLNTKRARLHGMDPQGDQTTVIKADAPQAEMVRYATDLRSITQGRATFTIEFSHYEEVPGHITQQVIAAAKTAREEQK